MRQFFRGWRRKAGVVTLILACLVMAAWMRSQWVQGQVDFAISSSSVARMLSFRGHLCLIRFTYPNRHGAAFLTRWESTELDKRPKSSGVSAPLFAPNQLQWSLLGVSLYRYPTHQALTINYVSIIVPLLLISAGCFRSNVVKNPPKPAAEM